MEKSTLFLDKSMVLRQIPLFAALNFFEKKLVLDSLEISEFKKSDMVYRQGDPPDSFYCMVTGRIEIFITKGGRDEILEYIHRGKYFGFISLLTGEPHSVSARAVNDTIIAKISRENFNVLLKSIPHLAIDLSQMLSRRLKRRDLHPKSIFESTIISVYGDDLRGLETSLYSLNLAYGIKTETHKKVILVDATMDSAVGAALGIDSSRGYVISQAFFTSEDVVKKIVHLEQGIDVLRIFPAEEKGPSAPFLISLVTMLVNDYHYCIVHLAPHFGPEALKVLSQSDSVHLLVAADALSLKKMSGIMEASGILTDAEMKKKIKLIVLEEEKIHGKGPKLSSEEEAALFHQPIFATLPPPKEKTPFSKSGDTTDPYAKVVRRISRQLGEVLVGLALGSGSAMGMAHIGVLKVLEKEEIPIDIVTGSSIGALIGALWCSGYNACEVEEIILKNVNKKYLFGFDDLTFPLHGLIKGRHIHRFLNKYLKNKTFYDVKRPFKIVACDCMSMRQVVFDCGKLVDAVMASVSIPGAFEPYRIADRYFIDGGILNPLPTDILVESGAKKIIAVNVLPSSDEIERTNELLRQREPEISRRWPRVSKLINLYKKRISKFLAPNIFDVIVSSVQSYEYLLASLSSSSSSDVTLHPDMTGVSWAAFENAPDLIKRGEDEALLHLKEIKELITQPD